MPASAGAGLFWGLPMTQPPAYTPKHLIDKILGSRSALQGERKQVTVLFVDVKDSMRLAARIDAEEWHRILDRFFAILADGIHRFEGTINQFTGDGVMALFGAPIAHEDHAQRACHAALLLCEQLRPFAQELRRTRKLRFGVRMGLNSGEVIVGAIGDDLRMDYTAQGHTVGLAARMQQSAATGRVYLTADTAALVSDFFTLEPVGKIRVKGVGEPVRSFALVGAGGVRSRIEASRARGFSRFVGRADEVARLEAALRQALSGHGQVVGVVGVPGVGKSRLCQDAVDRWRAEGVAVAEVHCPAHGRSLPYGALRDLLRSSFGITTDERPAPSARKVRARLKRLRVARPEDAALVLEFLGLPHPSFPLPKSAVDARRERLFALVCGLVQAQSALEPTVLLIDDAQWLDAASEAFLTRLVDAVGWTRTLLLLNARSDYSAPWMAASYHQQLELSPLTADATDALLHDLVGDDASLAELSALIGAKAEGNPFFAEEIVQSLLDQGVLAREPARMRLLRPIGEIRIPATLQSLVASRIDSLPEPAKHVLQVAAVIGRSFSETVLRRLLESDAFPADELPAALRTLERADLVHLESEEAETRYRFKHPLTQEVAYTVQLQETRTQRHEAVARVLQSLHEDRLGAHAALLAYHWGAAGKSHESERWRRRAALRVTNIQLRRARPPRA